MATEEEYAVFAARTYPRKNVNKTALPEGWEELERSTNNVDDHPKLSHFLEKISSKTEPRD